MKADNQTPPQPPEGCVYGPWWDDLTKRWWAFTQVGETGWNFNLWYWNYSVWEYQQRHSIPALELLRVAAERDELRAEVERLKKFEPKAKVIDCSKGQHNWKRVAGTDSISECQVCGRQSGK